MQRRHFLRNTGLTLASLAFLNKESLAAFLSDPAWKIKMLTDKIGIFTEKGGTILFMLNDEGTIVVDSQFPDSAQHLIDELKNKTQKPYRMLINTHHHADHTAGNIAFKELTSAILAHENSKINQQNAAVKQKTEDKQLYPTKTYTGKWCEKIGKENICLHYFGAGHTNGDSIVHFQDSNIIHMGDLVFNRRHPYVDRSAGASITNWIKILEKTTDTFGNKTQYVCGHAGDGYETVITSDDLKVFGTYLGNVMKFTESEMKSGKSKEEIIKATEIPGSPEWKGAGIERPLTAAFEEFEAK